MFGPAFFGAVYYGPRYFGPGEDVAVVSRRGGGFYPDRHVDPRPWRTAALQELDRKIEELDQIIVKAGKVKRQSRRRAVKRAQFALEGLSETVAEKSAPDALASLRELLGRAAEPGIQYAAILSLMQAQIERIREETERRVMKRRKEEAAIIAWLMN